MLKPGICFYFEDNDIDVYSGRRIDLDCWHYAIKCFGISTMRVINKTNQVLEMTDVTIDFKVYNNEEEFLLEHTQDKLIYFESPSIFTKDIVATDLPKFQHPTVGDGYLFYCLGPANGFGIIDNDNRTWVTIPQVDSRVAMHSVHSVILILYDRFLKLHYANLN